MSSIAWEMLSEQEQANLLDMNCEKSLVKK